MTRFSRTAPIVAFVLATGLSTGATAVAADATTTKREPKGECIAASERAQQLRRANKLLEASAQLPACLDAACPGPVREDCTRLSAEVDAATPTIVLAAQDPAGNDIGAARVWMDGQPFAEKLDGRALSVNPGEHNFVFQTQGAPPVGKTIIVAEGEKNRRERVVLAIPGGSSPASATPTPIVSPAPPQPPPTPATAPVALVPMATAPAPPLPIPDAAPVTRPAMAPSSVSTTNPSSHDPPIGALILGGIGAAGVVVGTISGVLALSKGSTLDGECSAGKTSCPNSAQSDISQLHTMQTLSSLGFGIGIGGVAIAAIVWLASSHPETKSSGSSVTAHVGIGSAGISGRF